MMNKLTKILAFIKVVETGGFSRAAILLCQSVSATSRQVGDLEAMLGHKLINRDSHIFQLTSFGRIYYPQALKLVTQYENMITSAKNHAQNPVGQLKIVAPEPFVIPYIVPCIKIFCAQYDKIIPYIDVSDRIIDFKREAVDVVLSDNIQTGMVNDTSNIIRKGLLQSNYILCASAKYLQKYGQIKDIHELEQHQVLCHAVHLEVQKSFLSHCTANIYVDNVYALVQCALNEMGVILILREYVEHHLATGALLCLLPEYNLQGSISLYYQNTRFANSKAKLFADILAKYIMDKANNITSVD